MRKERRRNHSCPIPYLDVPAGIPDIDLTDNSTPASGCRNPRGEMSRGEWPLGDRVREREVLHTEVWRLHACKSVLCKYVSRQIKVLGGSALRRTSFKEQTVKADHPPEIHHTLHAVL